MAKTSKISTKRMTMQERTAKWMTILQAKEKDHDYTPKKCDVCQELSASVIYIESPSDHLVFVENRGKICPKCLYAMMAAFISLNLGRLEEK